ncbi:hypothetical protein ACIGDI_38340 [Streptomyces sp. NPDC085900]|uniref:hypothetical protein n=1 Tax=unclassified Streptomyces TaxID=2593676 RepID=UPI00190DF5F4|nr:hypothetical protein [Streptomyces sp. MBT33]MBK3641179.1 hypothetical protein [Streptomyces sp. MBT33]
MTKKLNAAVKSLAVTLTAGVSLAVAVPAVAVTFAAPVQAAASVLADPIGWGTTNSAPTSDTVVSAGAQGDPIGW